MKKRMKDVLAFADRYCLPLGAVLAALLAGALALYNVSSGPLSNLNDIGGWSNRALFIAMTAAVHALVLMMQAAMCRKSFVRLALRQMILTVGLFIALLAINQKTYLFVEQVLPLVRQMDEIGLAAESPLNLSAPALTVLYGVTRGPVYDMYMLKLLCIGCFLALAVLAARAADRHGLGWRAEVLLALCVILPQGFLAAGCAAQIEALAALLLGVSLTLLDERKSPFAAMLVYGAAVAVSGAALYALPLVFMLGRKDDVKPAHIAAACAAALLACVPAIVGGMPVGKAFASLLNAQFALPEYAAGVPNFASVFPRAAMEEMPEYFMLKQVPNLDPVTNATEFYTQAHFTVLSRGMAFCALAAYIGLCAWLWNRREMSAMKRVFILAVGAMVCCPGAGVGMWLPVSMLCLAAILTEPELRLPACIVLFATAGGCCYPVTGETLVRPVYAFALCAAALLMAAGIIPFGAGKEEERIHG